MLLRIIIIGLFSQVAQGSFSKEYEPFLLKMKNEKTLKNKFKVYNDLKLKIESQIEKIEGKENFSIKDKFEIELGGVFDLYPESAFQVMNCDSIKKQISSDYTGIKGTQLSQAAEFSLRVVNLLCKK